MAEDGDQKEVGKNKMLYIAALVAGIMLVLNGALQLADGKMPLGIASVVMGAAAIAYGIIKPVRKS